MLNERLRGKIRDEFLGKGIKYTEAERKAILKAYRGKYGGRVWKKSIFEMYQDFLTGQREKGYQVSFPEKEFHVYDLAALAYLYKRVKETEVISEAHHVVIDEAQDFGMMAYLVLKFCIRGCTYTVMGDVSQNIHFGYGLNDWEELKKVLLTNEMDSFGVLKKSYRNTVEISDFAGNILGHGSFSIYPAQPIIRHGNPVQVEAVCDESALIKKAADICRKWQKKGLDTIAVICRDQKKAAKVSRQLAEYVEIMETDPEKAVFGSGIMVLPVEYTKGLEFDAVLILNPAKEEYPVDDGHAKLLYVAATRALHELCVLHLGMVTELLSKAPDLPKKENFPKKNNFPKEDNFPKKEKEKTKLQCSSWETAKIPVEEKQKQAAAGAETAKRKKPIARLVNPSGTMSVSTPEEKKPFVARIRPLAVQGSLTSGGMTESFIRNVSATGRRTIERSTSATENISDSDSSHEFGDMPDTEKLRPAGHGKIDLGVRWVMKQEDGLYLQSRYGTLRISPVESGIIRITFARGGQIPDKVHSAISLRQVDQGWMYKDSGSEVMLMTDDLCLQVDKAGGAIRYLTRDKKLLLTERSKECRQFTEIAGGKTRSWMFFELQKREAVFCIGRQNQKTLNLRDSARYISHGNGKTELPLIFSDKGYGIVPAAEGSVIFCDIPTYGTYFSAENVECIDYYFIVGKQKDRILNAYERL